VAGLSNSNNEAQPAMSNSRRIALMVFICSIAIQVSGPAYARQTDVQANAGWIDTGVDISAKDRAIRVLATGLWSYDGLTSCGPSGVAGVMSPDAPMSTMNRGALIGKVGSSVFLIGNAPVVQVGAAGRLFIAMNDSPAELGDNSGALAVDINKEECKIVGAGVERCIERGEDGTVNLYLNPLDPSPWKERWAQQDEPEKNYCGPTAAKNFLFWYGMDSPYEDLAAELNTNHWDTLAVGGAAGVACAFVPTCTSAVASVVSELLVKAGTRPSDLRKVMYGTRMRTPYRACGEEGHNGLPNIHNSLADGNPIIVFESREADNVHWAMIVGLYTVGGKTWVRMANSEDRTWSDFVVDWSIDKAGNRFVNKVVQDDLLGIGLKPYMSLSWCVCSSATRCGPQYECGAINDGCGGSVSCGACPTDKRCDTANHQCVPCREVCNQQYDACEQRARANSERDPSVMLRTCRSTRERCMNSCNH
jgi:hypothetical protein